MKVMLDLQRLILMMKTKTKLLNNCQNKQANPVNNGQTRVADRKLEKTKSQAFSEQTLSTALNVTSTQYYWRGGKQIEKKIKPRFENNALVIFSDGFKPDIGFGSCVQGIISKWEIVASLGNTNCTVFQAEVHAIELCYES